MSMNRRSFLRTGTGVLATAGLAGSGLAADGKANVAPTPLRAAAKSVQDAKRAKLAALRELGPTVTDFEIRRKKKIPGKCAAFYIDDVIFLFRDLVDKNPKSCWSHPFFAHLKKAWELYGVKTLLNLYPLKDIVPCFDRAGEPEFFCYATHEQYFFSQYFMYQPEYVAKTLAAGKWILDHGYSFIFLEDSVD